MTIKSLNNVRLVLMALIILLGMSSHGRADTAWVGDLPVPADAMIHTSDSVNFDSPSGRIIRFVFETQKDAADITRFYRNRLTALGWQSVGDSYTRGTEILTITEQASDNSAKYHYKVVIGPNNQ